MKIWKIWKRRDSIFGFSQSYEHCCYSFEKLLFGSISYQTLRISILVKLTLIRWGRTNTHTHTQKKHTVKERERGYFFNKTKRTKVLNCSSLFRWWQITFWEPFLASFCFHFCFVCVFFSFCFWSKSWFLKTLNGCCYTKCFI